MLRTSSSTGVARPKIDDLHLELLLVGLDLLDRAREVRERAVDDADLVAHVEVHAGLRLDRALDDRGALILDLAAAAPPADAGCR